MSVLLFHDQQPDSFAFTDENRQWAEAQVKKYPPGRQASAVLALLRRAQKQGEGWLSEPAIRHVAEFLDMPLIRVLEIATFYTLFNLRPVGKYFVQLCGTTPCWLKGADNLKQICRRYIGPEGEMSSDGMLSWKEVECLGACVDAPVVQINDDYHENLDPDELADLLKRLRAGEADKDRDKRDTAQTSPHQKAADHVK